MINTSTNGCCPARGHRVICAFYASTTYGSEYRAGLEFIRYAAAHGFSLAVVADLEENSPAEVLEAEAPGIKVMRIPSPVTRQATLYRYTDVLPQTVWHLRVARWLARQNLAIHTLWVQNGAQPWLPLVPYFKLAPNLVWGPVGCGEPATPAMMDRLPWRARLREVLRSALEQALLNRKFSATQRPNAPRVLPLARTGEARHRLTQGLHSDIPVIPEILDPLGPVQLHRRPSVTPRFLWVGQDIPRKNLRLALEIYRALRQGAFPDATLDIFGCDRSSDITEDGVRFHGWVPGIDWPAFQNDGVLLLTSFREGLPSVVLEAIRHGLLCVTADVGAIASLDVATLHTLPRGEYPCYSVDTLQMLANRILQHLAQTTINLPAVSHRDRLTLHLTAEGVLT